MTFKSLATATLTALALSAGIAHAQSQPFKAVEEPTRWKVDVGGGFVKGFSASGGDTDGYNWTFWGSASYRDILYANGLDGLGWNAVKKDDFHAGVQLRPRFATRDIDGFADRPELGADAALYAYKRLPGNIVVGGRIQHDVVDDNAGLSWTVQASTQRVTPVGLLQVMAYGKGSDADRINRYFGVSAADSAASGVPQFEAKGGVSAAGAAALLAVPIGDRYGIGAFANYEQYLGDTADSPLLKDDYVWRTGIIGVMRFNGM